MLDVVQEKWEQVLKVNISNIYIFINSVDDNVYLAEKVVPKKLEVVGKK